MKKSSFWPWATVAVAAASVLYTSLSSSRARQKGRLRKPYQEYDIPPEYERVFEKNPLVPAGWSFGVAWSTIYAGLAGLVIHQALPTQQDNPRYTAARPWLWLNFGLNAVFGRYFSDNDPRSVVISDVVTKLNLPASLALHQQLEIGKTAVSGPEEYLRIPVSLYSGWLTVANVIGTPNSLLTLDWWERDARRDEPLSVGLVGATGALGYVVAQQLNDPWYMVPFVIGFGGIATRQPGRNDALATVAGGLAAVYVALLAYWLPKKNFRPLQPSVEDAVTEVKTIRPAAPEPVPDVPESLVELD